MIGMKPEDIHNIAWMGDCDISPDASKVLYTLTRLDKAEDDYRSAIWSVSTDGGEPVQFTAEPKRDASPRWSLDGGSPIQLTDGDWDDTQPTWTPDGRSVVFASARPVWLPDGSVLSVAQSRGRQGLISAKAGDETGWLTEADRMVSWYSISADGSRAAVVSSSITSPGELSVIDLPSGKEQQVTHHNQNFLTATQIATAERFVAPAAEGVEVDC